MSKAHSKVRQRGVLHVEWESSTFSARWPLQEHSTARLVLNGSHPGCVERLSASPLPGVCSFDGRLSVAFLNGIYHLYARQNPTARCTAGKHIPRGLFPRLLAAYSPFHLHRPWVALLAGVTATCSTLSPPTSSPGRRSDLCASPASVPPRGSKVQARSTRSVRGARSPPHIPSNWDWALPTPCRLELILLRVSTHGTTGLTDSQLVRALFERRCAGTSAQLVLAARAAALPPTPQMAAAGPRA